MEEYRYHRRAAVPDVLHRALGVTVKGSTLAKMASLGSGPPVEYFGRIPVYREDRLISWGRSRIGLTPRHLSASSAT